MSNEVYDAILDRPEPTDLYALVRELEQRVRTLEALNGLGGGVE